MFRAMRLRDRMTLWYTALTALTVGAFACALYFLVGTVLQEMLEREARLSLQQLSAQVEVEEGMLTFENEVPLSTGSMYYIMEENGSELASYGSDIALLDGIPLAPGVFQTVTLGADTWLLLDSAPITVEPGKTHEHQSSAEATPLPGSNLTSLPESGQAPLSGSGQTQAMLRDRQGSAQATPLPVGNQTPDKLGQPAGGDGASAAVSPPKPVEAQGARFVVRVRVAVSCALKQRVLATLLWVFGIGIPLVALVALAGGFQIARRALLPIQRIIRSAGVIAGGDLSERIPRAPARDELGELTDTLNRMLASVEDAFAREKRFTSDASHELRTPVAVLRAYAEGLLAENDLPDERRAALRTMLAECDRMQKIIGQLLTITRGQEGRFPLVPEPLSLRAVCDGVAETLADALAEKRIALRVNVQGGLTVEADQSLFTQLLLNLLENAVKYGRPDGMVEIAARAVDAGVEITVRDDGIGIPAEALPHIFERFYRVDAARDRSGTGLGLSIVQWIVEAHGGSIHVESKPGKGTRFLLRFPARQGGG